MKAVVGTNRAFSKVKTPCTCMHKECMTSPLPVHNTNYNMPTIIMQSMIIHTCMVGEYGIIEQVYSCDSVMHRAQYLEYYYTYIGKTPCAAFDFVDVHIHTEKPHICIYHAI